MASLICMLISINFTYNLITGYRKVILVGDSIIKGIPPIEGVTLSAHPGATIANLSVFFYLLTHFIGRT